MGFAGVIPGDTGWEIKWQDTRLILRYGMVDKFGMVCYPRFLFWADLYHRCNGVYERHTSEPGIWIHEEDLWVEEEIIYLYGVNRCSFCFLRSASASSAVVT